MYIRKICAHILLVNSVELNRSLFHLLFVFAICSLKSKSESFTTRQTRTAGGAEEDTVSLIHSGSRWQTPSLC